MRLSLAAIACVSAASAPTAAFAVDYLSAEQAAQALFAEADRFEQRELSLDAEQLQQLRQAGIKPRSARWSLRLAWRGKELLGVVVADAVWGKYEMISYAVGVGQDGRLRGIEILSYRESHGHEIRLPAWRKQFVGKTAAAPLQVGEDIANISGATLSCSHVTDGVKRIVSVLDLARRQGLLS
ncbi:FMN-binding protein [Roseateles albus]|uniref:FMN-binding protein n=1 Tax=Roseateles albus TaxID=2987525 RepID=A0ABT5KHT2_9BURK|nr:FMN-binding protein [Roseateles albus]MDC8773467.1 FMN-binding protein [Roseateles albus]